jgi:hypothetical protein
MSARLRVEKLPDLARFDVSAELRFLEYRLAVAEDFEPAAPRWNQINFYTGIVVPELSRQTGGSGLIVSNDAVLDADSHGRSQFWFGLKLTCIRNRESSSLRPSRLNG